MAQIAPLNQTLSRSGPPLRLRLDPQGRVVIPAEVRRRLELTPGEDLVVRLEDGKLVMEKRENVLRRLRARFAQVPSEISLADELIADRRREAALEGAASENEADGTE